MPTVCINPPKTPVTKGSGTIATATVPNICKMPGPPAPFVPTPLPNIGKGDKAPQDGYSTSVKIEGNEVAIKGASFGSMGDIASKGTGGGIVSNNAEGPTTFIAPGSLDVKIEGKNVQLLGDQMLNNNGPTGSPPNAACMMGALHGPGSVNPLVIKCKDAPAKPKDGKKFTACEKQEICAKCKELNKLAAQKKLRRRSARNQKIARKKGNQAAKDCRADAVAALAAGTPVGDFKDSFHAECAFNKMKNNPAPKFKGFSPDHTHEIQVGGCPTSPSNLKWMSSKPNSWIGGQMKAYNKGNPKNTGVAPDCCD